jgi:hypothetical protein
VVASVDTYLRFAEAVNRLDIAASDDSEGLPELLDDLRESGAKKKTKGALEGAKDTVSGMFGGDDDDEAEDDDSDAADEQEERPRKRRTSNARRRSSNGSEARRARRRTPARDRE